MTGAVLLLAIGAFALLAVLSSVASLPQDTPRVRRSTFAIGFLAGGAAIAVLVFLAAGYWVLRQGLPILG